MNNNNNLMRLLQFTDSAFPVGTFSFSNGLETASFEGIVYDKETLKQYTRSISYQAAFSDGVAAINAYKAAKMDDYDSLVEVDKMLMMVKMNEESRVMLTRMGRKMVEMGKTLFDNALLSKWLKDIQGNKTPGTYPVAQGLIFSIADISEHDLFISSQYGVINMILNAALRCVKVSHYDTQSILFELSNEVEQLYEKAKELTIYEMNTFVPEIDILASLHEKGTMRMFMN